MDQLNKFIEFFYSPRFSYVILFLITLVVGLLFVLHAKQSQDEEMRLGRNMFVVYTDDILVSNEDCFCC